MTDTQTAQEFSGDFYDLFEQTLSNEDLKNIQGIRSDTLMWVSGDWQEKVESTMVTNNQERKTLKERIKAEEINMMLFDDLIAFDRFAKTIEETTGRKLLPQDNPHILALMTRKNNSIINGILEKNTVDSNGNVINDKDNLDKIVKDVGENILAFEAYLKVKHALTLQDKGHQILNKELEVSQDKIDMMELRYPEFKAQSERLYEWYDTFFKAWVIDTNMLGKDSKAIYKAMREQYPYYVPMFRSMKKIRW